MPEVLQRLVTDATMQEILEQLVMQNSFLTALHGDKEDLATVDKTSLVAAINEVLGIAAPLRRAHAVADAGDGAGFHNSFYVGESLGSSFTAEQANAIATGTFKGLHVGNYWRMTTTYSYKDDNNVTQTETITVTWRIADCNYLLHSGDTEILGNHVIVIPDAPLYQYVMNDTDTTVGAYAGSKMRTKGLERAKALFRAAFGSGTLMPHRTHIQNAVTNGYPSGGTWYDSDGVELMTEQQVYGGLCFNSGSPDGAIIPNRYTVACKQFNLFRHRPDLISSRSHWFWLQDVVSGARFAGVDNRGAAYGNVASNGGGWVRPAFALRKAA